MSTLHHAARVKTAFKLLAIVDKEKYLPPEPLDDLHFGIELACLALVTAPGDDLLRRWVTDAKRLLERCGP